MVSQIIKLNGDDLVSIGSSQFFNDAQRKAREPGKIHHVRDNMWKGLGAAHTHFY